MSDLAFHALREYVPGDDLRHVHWRSSAKAGELLVRQYHETRRGHVTVLLDDRRSSYPRLGDFELAVSVAASIALRAVRDDFDTYLRCGSHLARGRNRRRDDRHRLPLRGHGRRRLPRPVRRRGDAVSGTGLVVQVTGPDARRGRARRRRSPLRPGRRLDPCARRQRDEPRVADAPRVPRADGAGPVPAAGPPREGTAMSDERRTAEVPRRSTDALVVVGTLALVLTLLDESFWSRDYLVAGLVPVVVLLACRPGAGGGPGRRVDLHARRAARLRTHGRAGRAAPAGALGRADLRDHEPGARATRSWRPRLFVSTLPPVEPSGTVMLLPYAIGFAAALPVAWLALATPRPLAPALPVVAAMAATIPVAVLVPDHYILRGVVLAVVLVAWAAARARRAESLVAGPRSGLAGHPRSPRGGRGGGGPRRRAGARRRPDGPHPARPSG